MKHGGGVQRLDLDVRAMIESYDAGERASDIAREHNVSRDTVLRRLEEAGVRRRHRNAYYRRLPLRRD